MHLRVWSYVAYVITWYQPTWGAVILPNWYRTRDPEIHQMQYATMVKVVVDSAARFARNECKTCCMSYLAAYRPRQTSRLPVLVSATKNSATWMTDDRDDFFPLFAVQYGTSSRSLR